MKLKRLEKELAKKDEEKEKAEKEMKDKLDKAIQAEKEEKRFILETVRNTFKHFGKREHPDS